MTHCPSSALSMCVCLFVCVYFSCYLHPTGPLPCFHYHSLFPSTDICGKISQTQTSHLASQINFAPLSNLRNNNKRNTYIHTSWPPRWELVVLCSALLHFCIGIWAEMQRGDAVTCTADSSLGTEEDFERGKVRGCDWKVATPSAGWADVWDYVKSALYCCILVKLFHSHLW